MHHAATTAARRRQETRDTEMSVRKRATGVLETGGFCYEERSVLFGKTARATTSAVASKDNGVQVANRMNKTILGAKDKGEENVISIKGTTGRQGSLVLVCRRLPLYSGTLYPNYATKNGGKRFISFRERTGPSNAIWDTGVATTYTERS